MMEKIKNLFGGIIICNSKSNLDSAKFGISSKYDKQLRFEYHFDDNGQLVLEKVGEFNYE